MQFTAAITVNLIQAIGSDAEIAAAARVERPPYRTDGIPELINYMMRHRHGTPFEHGTMTFHVHAPIFVFREWQRHRIGWGYNEESARYKQLEPVFWVPAPTRAMIPVNGFRSARPAFEAASADQYHILSGAIEHTYALAYGTYTDLIETGIAREVARAVLPVGIYSSMWATCDPRSLMHFLSLRTSDETAAYRSYPQYEIEDAARQMERIFAKLFPLTHTAFNALGRVAP
jgi:thymidylate synthase (FAD)